MTYQEVLENAKKVLAPKCKVCPVCDGVACRGQMPGLGGKGSGRAFTVCREFFASIKLNMDCVHEHFEPDTKVELFGRHFEVPFFVACAAGMPLNYTGYLTEQQFCEATVFGALAEGSFAFTGDGPTDDFFPSTLPVIEKAGGVAVSTIKPWANEKVFERIRQLEEVHAMAFAMDVDSAAHSNLKLLGKPVFAKGVEDLKEIVASTQMPFLVKGIMTPKSAIRCQQAGAYGIVVSSHGGRVLEDAPAPASMLPQIRKAVGNSFKIIVDGGIRSGADVFKCLALGADAVLIGRPYAIAAHGGLEEGVRLYTQRIASELKEIMILTDTPTLADITMDKLVM